MNRNRTKTYGCSFYQDHLLVEQGQKLPYETTMDLCCWRNFHEKMMVIKLSYGKRWRLHLQRKLVSIQSLGDWKKSWTHPYCLSTGLIAVMPIESPSCLR